MNLRDGIDRKLKIIITPVYSSTDDLVVTVCENFACIYCMTSKPRMICAWSREHVVKNRLSVTLM